MVWDWGLIIICVKMCKSFFVFFSGRQMWVDPYRTHTLSIITSPYGSQLYPSCKSHIGRIRDTHIGPILNPIWGRYGSHIYCLLGSALIFGLPDVQSIDQLSGQFPADLEEMMARLIAQALISFRSDARTRTSPFYLQDRETKGKG